MSGFQDLLSMSIPDLDFMGRHATLSLSATPTLTAHVLAAGSQSELYYYPTSTTLNCNVPLLTKLQNWVQDICWMF